ncbi:glycine oxidase ThiO [Brevibacillus borstelensis]|jgi:glycine oxidase|uniref:glycine oxidase ThiO n=1 Tax=Brevibacillus borstelensis TaxID=45462 RepID=UPI00046A83BD|nr:glycine oxidase ThiO [Brevibacillus borstelensis]MBE5395486.1 glycine oxidase ThiO [Brevibacillus borstelensis]MCM3592931.1 glycine oxidase ThiO [Brevibacillus borstelensis]MED1744611.1 glycine oxidase ThiO [Brevibacillus borstelensis]MED1854211.1 glycine oxidase ThiO [Brevibacillus borstelensis]MED1873269.1 glycine oxidase ThiO [Brevibacillus borstelensis]
MTDCLLVGGGIIGLSLAYELSCRGMAVTVVEQGEWGGQASSAAAGMLAPLKEFSQPGPMLELGMKSLELYPKWAEELEARTGIDVQACKSGLLTVALTEPELGALLEKYKWQKASGYAVEWMTGEEMRRVEPLLTEQAIAGIYSPEEGHINNRMLLNALVAACKKMGATLLSGSVVTGMAKEGGRIVGVETTTGPLRAGHTVIASGAWAGIMAEWLDFAVPVRPVRGQVASVSSSGIPLRTVIFGTSGYITPKLDGKIVLGATEDEAGFQRHVTLSGLAKVLDGVMPYVPALHSAAFQQAWAGLRPATADSMPLLGPVPGWQGVSIAGGHFRNGILLSPVTAKVMADYVESGREDALQPFLPSRFLGSTTNR